MVNFVKHWNLQADMKKVCLFSSLFVMLCAGTVFATPANIIRVPSADVQPYGTFHLDIDTKTTMARSPQKNTSSNPAPPAFGSTNGAYPTTFGLTAGFYDIGNFQVEGGIDVREPTDAPVSFNLKVAMPEGAYDDLMPAVFAGGYDFGTDTNETGYNILYAGVAKSFSFIGRFTAGAFTGNTKLLKDANGKTDNSSLFFGFDTRLPRINEKLWFGIDYMGTNSLYGALSFGFAWSFSENTSLTIGYIRYNERRVVPTRNDTVTWQVDFDF